MQRSQYDAAITEYKRFLCFNPEDERASDVYLRIGKAYLELGDHPNAIASLQGCVESATDDTMRDDRRISAGVILIAVGEYSAAESDLTRVKTFSADEGSRRRAALFLGVCCVYTFRWQEARQEFDACFAGKSGPEIEGLRALLAPEALPRLRSPKTARNLSTILPGAGQAYAGDYRDALKALCVNAVFGIPFGRAVLDGRLLDGASVFSYFQRFYSGNRANSVKAAESHNDRLNRRHAERVLEALAKAAANASVIPNEVRDPL